VTESPQQPERPEEPTAPPPPAQPPAAPTPTPADVTPSAPEVAYPTYPVLFDVRYQEEYSRWMPLIKWLLAIPHWFALFFLAIGAFFALIIAFFAVLITARYPKGLFDFMVGVWRWGMRVTAYVLLLVDPYPPFSLGDDPSYPVRFNVDYPPEGKIARWRALFAWVPVIPQLIIASIVTFVAWVLEIVVFFSILFTKGIPRGVFDFIVNAFRYQNRANAYAYYLTEKYPGFAWG
jgi:hypothetical protein